MNILITESQLKSLISEQANPNVFTVSFNNAFPSGQYNLTPAYQKVVNDNVQKIYEYVKGKNITNFKLVLSAGESQVTNPKGFEQKGSLAQKRMDVLEGYLKPILQNLGMNAPIEKSQPVIGTTPYKAGVNNPNEEQYVKEQFVSASVVVLSQPNNQPTQNPYFNSSHQGEALYLGNTLIGFTTWKETETKDIKNQGQQDTAHQDLIFTEVKKDTIPFQPIGQYIVPWQWWNTRAGAESRHITPDQLEKIRTFPKTQFSNFTNALIAK